MWFVHEELGRDIMLALWVESERWCSLMSLFTLTCNTKMSAMQNIN